MTGEELKVWRKGKRLSQGQLAEALGVSQPTMSAWEKGTRAIPDDLEDRLAMAPVVVAVPPITEMGAVNEGDPTVVRGMAREYSGGERQPDADTALSITMRLTNEKARLENELAAALEDAAKWKAAYEGLRGRVFVQPPLATNTGPGIVEGLKLPLGNTRGPMQKGAKEKDARSAVKPAVMPTMDALDE